jgi:PhnB protein
MARVSTYLNFPRSTEQAFLFYKSVFGSEFVAPIHRFRDMPANPGQPPLAEADRNLVMHVELPILGGHVLMGTDAPESMGFSLIQGNNVFVNLEPDTRAETDRLFKALSEGGKVDMPLQEMFWGGYFASFTDRFGVRWMFNCPSKT